MLPTWCERKNTLTRHCELPLTSTCSCVSRGWWGRTGNTHCWEFSLYLAGSHLSPSFCRIITPMNSLTHSMFSLVCSTLFLILCFTSSSICPLFIQWIQQCACCRFLFHSDIHALFPPFLRCYFLHLLPSFLLTLWQPGLMRCMLPEPRIHVMQGRRWGTLGLGPLAKTTSPPVCLMSASTHRCVPQILHTFSQNTLLSLNRPSISFSSFLNLKWKPTENCVQSSV